MKLLLDQGNSRLKWLLVARDGTFLARGVSASDLLPETLESLYAGESISQIALSSVASATRRDTLCERVASLFGRSPDIMVTQQEWAGLHNGYADPSRLGVDRWLAMLGARQLGSGAWLVVDAGTALTLDAIDSSGRHLGGYIVPGYGMQLSMLEKGTAAISRAGLPGDWGWGKDTASAVANGVGLGLVALVERALVELSGSLRDTCRLVITGGDAALLQPHLSREALLDEDLIFRGMLCALTKA